MRPIRIFARFVRSFLEPAWLIHLEAKVSYFVVRILKVDAALPKKERIVLTPFLDGSRGDEALLKGALAAPPSPSTVVCKWPATRHSRAVKHPHQKVFIPGILYGLPPFSFFASIRFIWIATNYKRLSVVGADVLDGNYWRGPSLRRILLSEAAMKLGLEVEIVGFSWPADFDSHCMKALSKIDKTVALVPRDAVSARRLIDLDVNISRVAPDLAFCIPNQTTQLSVEVERWISKCSSMKKPIIALGLNSANLGHKISLARLAYLIQNSCPGYAVLLTPMDERIFAGDRRASNRFALEAARLGLETFTIANETSVEELISILRLTSFSITFRMHLAVLTFLAENASIGIEYAGKFRGLYGLFNLETLVLSKENHREQLDPKISWLVKNYQEVQARIKQRLPEITVAAGGVPPA